MLPCLPFWRIGWRALGVVLLSLSPVMAQPVDPALTAAADRGSVPMIVELRVPVQPEALLSGDEVRAQRQALAAARGHVLGLFANQRMQGVKTFETLPYVALRLNAAQLAALAADPHVARIVADEAVPALLGASTQQIGATAARASGWTGAGQAVAILDTGVEAGHPFLGGRVAAEACFSTSNPAMGVQSACPNGADEQTGPGAAAPCAAGGCAHGTHVAGITAGSGPSFSGVAPEASILAVQVFSVFTNPFDCGGAGAPCALSYTSDQLAALEWVYAQRSTHAVAAINMSLGGGMNTRACDTDVRKPIIDNLRAAGIATVIASGNNGYKTAISTPACISSAISVGSVDNGTYGTVRDAVSPFSNSSTYLTLLAPGRWIQSSVTGGGYQAYQGTSMAAPHVAGAFAVMKHKFPTGTVPQILQRFQDAGVAVRDPRNGYTKKRVQLDAALNVSSLTAVFVADITRTTASDLSATGGTMRFTTLVRNVGGATGSTKSWVVLTRPNATVLNVGSARSVSLRPGYQSVTSGYTSIRSTDPNGTYTLTQYVGTPNVAVLATDAFTFNKGAAPRQQDDTATDASAPYETAVLGAFPNPFADRATLAFTLARPARVTVTAYDLLGREVAALAQDHFEPGRYEVQFEAADLPAGVYLVRVTLGAEVFTHRLTLTR